VKGFGKKGRKVGKYGMSGRKVKGLSIIRKKWEMVGIILAKAEKFRRSWGNENVHVRKRTSGMGQYLSPKKGNWKNIKRL